MPRTKRKKILLDLDQTCICSVQKDEIDIKDPANKEKIERYSYHQMDEEYTSDCYVVFERPHLQEFLDYLFANYDVSVWTAASGDYASFIERKIILGGKSGRKLDYILWRDHCNMSICHYDRTKRLNMLWDQYKSKGYKSENTIILDDNPDVWEAQEDMCIKAKIFDVMDSDSHNDDFLLKVKECLQKYSTQDRPAKAINDELNISVIKSS